MIADYPTRVSCRGTRFCADLFLFLARANREVGKAARGSFESDGAATEDNSRYSVLAYIYPLSNECANVQLQAFPSSKASELSNSDFARNFQY
jgi:hypothetical protein